MFKEFREFAVKGNMIDLAVGIILGVAFGAAVNSLVEDIFTPFIGLLAGNVQFNNLFLVLREGATAGPYVTQEAAIAAGAITINLGNFINAVINFVLVAFALFFVVKGMNRLRTQFEKKEEVAETVVEATTEEKLLTEIRDLLKVRS